VDGIIILYLQKIQPFWTENLFINKQVLLWLYSGKSSSCKWQRSLLGPTVFSNHLTHDFNTGPNWIMQCWTALKWQWICFLTLEGTSVQWNPDFSNTRLFQTPDSSNQKSFPLDLLQSNTAILPRFFECSISRNSWYFKLILSSFHKLTFDFWNFENSGTNRNRF